MQYLSKKNYKSQRSLLNHKHNSHSSVNTCNVCEKTIVNRESFKVHIKTQHSTERSFGQSFGIYSKENTRRSPIKKLSSCPYCPKTFSTKYRLRYHIRDFHQYMDIRILLHKSFIMFGTLIPNNNQDDAHEDLDKTLTEHGCDNIMKNIHKLEQNVPEDLLPIIDTLKALQNVKSSCFGPKLGEGYEDDINTFEEQWMHLHREFQLLFSNKCHVIIEHVPQAIERSGASLYLTSEQVVEASHQKFNVFWERYKVLDLERPMHGDNLLACDIDFNSCNL